MKNFRRTAVFPKIGAALIGFTFLFQGLGSASPQNPLQPPAPQTPDQRMDKLFAFWNRLDQPGFAVVVVKDGRVLYQKAFGLACQEHAAPIGPNTVFNVGEAAQPFVGQAVALLEKKGVLSLDDDVRKRIPEIPDFGTPVKLRDLLFHTSGLRDWQAVLPLTGRERDEVTMGRVLKVVQAQKKLIFAPGERAVYTNTDYDLLAETVARATGQPFSEWVFENVFKPLKMTRTQFRDSCRSIFDNEALTYNYTRSEYLRGIDTISLAGSHSLFTSTADLAKWFVRLETASDADLDGLEKAYAPGQIKNGASAGFAYGWDAESEAGRRKVVKTGQSAGSQSIIAYYPDQKFGFAVLANWDYISINAFSEISDIYLPAPAPKGGAPARPAAPAKSVSVSPQKLDRYVGTYRWGANQTVAFVRSGDELVYVPGGRFVLKALSDTQFFWDLIGAKITFQVDKDGTVSRCLWSSGGEDIVLRKIHLVKPTAADLKAYEGSFANDEIGARFAVEARGETLVLRGPGGADVALSPDEKDRFTSRMPSLPSVVFQRDAQGRVTGFVVDSDPVRDLLFKRD